MPSAHIAAIATRRNLKRLHHCHQKAKSRSTLRLVSTTAAAGAIATVTAASHITAATADFGVDAGVATAVAIARATEACSSSPAASLDNDDLCLIGFAASGEEWSEVVGQARNEDIGLRGFDRQST